LIAPRWIIQVRGTRIQSLFGCCQTTTSGTQRRNSESVASMH